MTNVWTNIFNSSDLSPRNIASQYNEIISQCPKPHPILPLKFFCQKFMINNCIVLTVMTILRYLTWNPTKHYRLIKYESN